MNQSTQAATSAANDFIARSNRMAAALAFMRGFAQRHLDFYEQQVRELMQAEKLQLAAEPSVAGAMRIITQTEQRYLAIVQRMNHTEMLMGHAMLAMSYASLQPDVRSLELLEAEVHKLMQTEVWSTEVTVH